MPELAEVEFYRKQWESGIGGRVVRVGTHPAARIYREIPSAAVRRGLEGREFASSRAHGKQMLFEFSEGVWLGVHLGMTGKLFTAESNYEPEKGDHLVLDLGERNLVFSDYRMFGKLTLDLCDGGDPPGWWRDLPPGVLDRGYSRDRFANFVKRFPKTPIKTLLLDQRGFPGIGNWMADEICWRLEVSPSRPAGQLDRDQVDALRRATRRVARDAVRVIGDSWERPPDSWLFNHRWKDGGQCPRRGCRADLERGDLRGRTTCWCPKCQS